MKVSARALTIIFALGAVTQCIFQRPEKNSSYDVNCGGVSIDSAESCFKLEVMDIVAIVPSTFTAANQPKTIDYYYKTTDNCSRDRLTGIARADVAQPGGEVCTKVPHASKLSALTSIVVTFVANCSGQGNFTGNPGEFQSSGNPTNGACSIELRADGGFKGKSLTTTAVLSVNIGVTQINGGQPMNVRVSDRVNCDADIKTTYGSGSLIQYTDGLTTAMPATGTWSYVGSGGSVDSAGVFTPSGANGNFSGTVTYTGVTTKNVTVALTFPVTISDGVYVTPGGSGNGCQNKPQGTLHSGIATANALSPKRTVYAAVGDYSFNSQGAGSIALQEGVSIRGGYNLTFTGNPTPLGYTRTCNAATMSCLVDTSTVTAFNRVITFGSGITAATVVDGFFIAGTSSQNNVAGTTNSAIYSTGGTPTIQNNTIFGGAPINGTGNFTLAAIEAQSAVIIKNNFIIGGVGPATASSSTVRAIYSVNGLNGLIANNVIDAGSNAARTTTYALQLTNGCHPTLTNNTIVSAWGSAVFMEDYGGSVNAFDGKITNNLIAWGGTATNYALHETHLKGGPRSIENNAFYPLNGTATTMYNRATGSSTIANLEVYASTGGSDKTRGNILLPSTGKPFVNFPRVIDKTTGAGATNTLIVTGPANLYNDNDYVEVNGDNIPRQVTCGGTPCSSLTLTITSGPLATASTANMEVRSWGTNNNASGTAYNINYNLALTQGASGLTAQLYNNLRYGGKDTSGDVCGAPSGGPGTGPGGESCGQITTDFRTPTRTAVNGNLADNTTNSAVPGGYSMGANERD